MTNHLIKGRNSKDSTRTNWIGLRSNIQTQILIRADKILKLNKTLKHFEQGQY